MNDHLYRSRDDRMLAGVAGGLAERWDMDPSIVRVVWAVLAIVTAGTAVLVYIVMAIVVPEEYEGYSTPGAAPYAGPAPVIPGWVAPGATGPTGMAPPPAATPGGEGAAAFVSGAPPVAADPAFASSPTVVPPPAPSPAAPSGPVVATLPMHPRDARRAARAARRAARPERSGMAGIVFGGVLVVVGGGFFVRELLPTFDFDWFGPLILIGLGVVLLVAGFARDSGTGRGPSA